MLRMIISEGRDVLHSLQTWAYNNLNWDCRSMFKHVKSLLIKCVSKLSQWTLYKYLLYKT